jgi:hypothetical protein
MLAFDVYLGVSNICIGQPVFFLGSCLQLEVYILILYLVFALEPTESDVGLAITSNQRRFDTEKYNRGEADIDAK